MLNNPETSSEQHTGNVAAMKRNCEPSVATGDAIKAVAGHIKKFFAFNNTKKLRGEMLLREKLKK